jgi:predicted Rossmann fold flavoprotein
MAAATDLEQVVVVGAGAAGVFGALACAEANPALVIHLLEAGREPLAKVKISGGGRCNVTHACFDPALLVNHYPRGSRALRGPFSRFQPRDTVAWFEQRGVTLKTEADGRIFPTSDDSATIIDCLLGEARRLGVHLHPRMAVNQVQAFRSGI